MMKLAILLQSLLLLAMGVLPVFGRYQIVPPDTSESRLRARITEHAPSQEILSLMDQTFHTSRSEHKRLEALLTWMNILGISGGLAGLLLLARSSQGSRKPPITTPS